MTPSPFYQKANGLSGSATGSLSVAFDKSNDAWIGTDVGLRTLTNAAAEVENNPQMEPIVIEQGGLAKNYSEILRFYR